MSLSLAVDGGPGDAIDVPAGDLSFSEQGGLGVRCCERRATAAHTEDADFEHDDAEYVSNAFRQSLLLWFRIDLLASLAHVRAIVILSCAGRPASSVGGSRNVPALTPV